MASTRAKKLAARYVNLAGLQLIKELAAGGETAMLEAFWRYGNPALAADAADPMLATQAPHLLSLVLDEILAPQLEPPAPEAILSAVDTHQPSLTKADSERLANRLRDGNPLHANYEPGRPKLVVWLLSQPGQPGDAAAIDVVAGRIQGSEHGNVRQAAHARCRDDPKVLNACAEVVGEAFETAPSHETWQQAAAEFIEQTCRDLRTTPASLQPLVRRLGETAPSYCQAPQFPETLKRLVLDSALDAVETVLAEQLTDTPGALALLALLPEITPAARRTGVWAATARTQAQLWPVLQQQTAGWEVDEWRRLLRALATAEPVHRAALNHLVSSAPLEITAETIRLVMAQVPPDDPLVSTVGQRLRERLQAFGEGDETRDEWVGAVHWPKERDVEEIEKFAAIAACLEPSLHVRLLVRGYLAGKLRANRAAALISAGQVGTALQLVAAGNRGKWAAELADAHPSEIASAVAAVTTPEDYDLEVVAALAAGRSDIAFAGVTSAWRHVSPEQKDELVELLEQHATRDSLDALCAVIEDDHLGNAKRRGRAARRIGRLLEPRETIPEPVLALLKSNLHDLRAAAVEVIERVQPHDPELIGRLHEVAAGRGVAGKAAANAIDALTREFLDEFAATSDKDGLAAQMPLLGAVGRSVVLRPLFGYLGGGALYDDPALHQKAATAVRAAAERIEEIGVEEQGELVALIDGEEQEADPDARAALSEALARLQLGEDAALKVLYDEINRAPAVSPERLFGAEREPLVRQLALLERARGRGQDGWGAELAHRDNVAERLVRAAYLVSDGASPNIVDQIRNDTRLDWGSLIKALASTKQLNAIQASCQVLHDARCDHSEIPHAGKQPDDGTMTSARQAYLKLAKVCVSTLIGATKNGP